MAYFGFKPNVKQQVVDKATRLFGRDKKIKVSGVRKTPLECKQLGIPVGSYVTDCAIDGQCIATANMRDWRKAYKMLLIEVEKAYETQLHSL